MKVQERDPQELYPVNSDTITVDLEPVHSHLRNISSTPSSQEEYRVGQLSPESDNENNSFAKHRLIPHKVFCCCKPAKNAFRCMTLRSAAILYALFDVVYAILHIINDSQTSTLVYYDRTFHMLIVANVIMSVVPSLIGIFMLMALANKRKLRCTFRLYGWVKFCNEAMMLQLSNILLFTKEGGAIAFLTFLTFSAFHFYGAYLLISSYQVLRYGLYDLFIGEAQEEEEEEQEEEEIEGGASPQFYLGQA